MVPPVAAAGFHIILCAEDNKLLLLDSPNTVRFKPMVRGSYHPDLSNFVQFLMIPSDRWSNIRRKLRAYWS